MPEALWVYGIAGAATEAPPVPGVDPAHAIRLIRDDGLAAIVSSVGCDMDAAVEDVKQLVALARAHAQVLDRALVAGPVVPFRVGALFASPAGVHALLCERHAVFAAALCALRGRAEWGVKLYVPSPRPPRRAPEPVASGADYLARRGAERASAERSRRDLLAALDATHARLVDFAADSALLPPRDGQALNAVHLVSDERALEFCALAERLAASHDLRTEITGPWPAYHFSEPAA